MTDSNSPRSSPESRSNEPAPSAANEPAPNPLTLDLSSDTLTPQADASSPELDADVDDPAALHQAEAELEQESRESVEGAAEAAADAPLPADLLTVATFDRAAEAHMAADRLQAEGIASFIADENTVATNWLFTVAVGGIKLQVTRADAERANALLQGVPHSMGDGGAGGQ